MSLNLLEHVAFAYQPIWGVGRQLMGVRLRVRALHTDSVDAAHLLTLLANEWSDQSPTLVVSFADQALLRQALIVPPPNGFWLEIPDFGELEPPGLVELLARAHRLGHRLLQDAPLARARPWPATDQSEHRYLLHLWPEQVVQTQQAIARQGQGSPVLAGQLYRDLGTRALVQHCLDNRQAWGVCGWPEDDVLRDHHRYGVPVDKRTLVRVQQALMREASMDVIEGLIHQDAVLTYRVLRLVNSPVFGATRQVTTVRQALMLLGQRRLSDWLLELMPGSSADRELLPVRLALVLRGRVMQALMDAGVQHDLATEIYLTGLFSRLDVLTQEPLAAALKRVPLSEPVAEALLRQSGPYAHYLDIACRLESFDQVQRLPAVCETAGFPLDQVNGGLLRTLAQWRNSL